MAPAEVDPLEPSARLRAMAPEYEGKVIVPSAIDLTGVWHDVPDNAPAGAFRRPPPCYEGLGFIALEQRGERVQMRRSFAEPMQGALPEYDIDQYERAAGTRRGDTIELSAELVRETRPTQEAGPTRREVVTRPSWTLTLDRGKGHLVGTRDGVAIRLAPLVLLTPSGNPTMRERCGGPPS